jgi:hypothetical protein
MVINVPLGQRGAEPAEKRPTPGVRSQRRTALAIELPQPVQFGIERVGEIMAHGCGAGDGDCGFGQRVTVDAEEALPGGIAAQSAGVGHSQLRYTEGAKEGSSLPTIGMIAGRQAIVDLFPDRREHNTELLAAKPAVCPLCTAPKLLHEILWELGL